MPRTAETRKRHASLIRSTKLPREGHGERGQNPDWDLEEDAILCFVSEPSKDLNLLNIKRKRSKERKKNRGDERVYSREREGERWGYCLALKREEDPMTGLLAIKALLEIFYLK